MGGSREGAPGVRGREAVTYGRKVEGDWMWLGGREGGGGEGGGWVGETEGGGVEVDWGGRGWKRRTERGRGGLGVGYDTRSVLSTFLPPRGREAPQHDDGRSTCRSLVDDASRAS